LSSSKGKGKAVLKPAQEEGRGPQTRNAARRRAALDKDVQMKPANGDSTSEVYFEILEKSSRGPRLFLLPLTTCESRGWRWKI
jgi:hypothetical protein